ncbi:MAG: orotidine-5'-phosphate decarboxylase [Acidobacteria bacterium]|nr:orotidine-5'-phosphate decarboxylase [Acidobacteriota bacterium]
MNPIIIALDCETASEARKIVDATSKSVGFYKVGLELYAAAGMEFVKELIKRRKKVFLDLKLHDIGETVRRATVQIAKSGVSFLTVHAEPQVMRAAVAGRGSSKLKILAVTVLTSLDQVDIHEMGYPYAIRKLFDLRVRNAMRAGVDGLVCSPLEVGDVRRIAGGDKLLVTPGVRSAGAVKGDQKRVATPAQAMADGASYLVVGRQVTHAVDPNKAVREILDELKLSAR